jgi:hypothetical protein
MIEKPPPNYFGSDGCLFGSMGAYKAVFTAIEQRPRYLIDGETVVPGKTYYIQPGDRFCYKWFEGHAWSLRPKVDMSKYTPWYDGEIKI